MKNNLIIKTIEHKGVTVHIRIDYDNGTAELVERVENRWQVKQWIFKPRGLEYMNGWLNIIEAMQVAVKECKKELERDLAEKTELRDTKIIKALKDKKIK